MLFREFPEGRGLSYFLGLVFSAKDLEMPLMSLLALTILRSLSRSRLFIFLILSSLSIFSSSVLLTFL